MCQTLLWALGIVVSKSDKALPAPLGVHLIEILGNEGWRNCLREKEILVLDVLTPRYSFQMKMSHGLQALWMVISEKVLS